MFKIQVISIVCRERLDGSEKSFYPLTQYLNNSYAKKYLIKEKFLFIFYK